MINKYQRDGQVAVLVSHGYGAGWSTWNSEYAEAMIFDPDIVQLVIDKAPTEVIEAKALEKWPDGYLGGARGLCVYWLDPGTRFEISEYDGNESLRIIDQIEHYVALG